MSVIPDTFVTLRSLPPKEAALPRTGPAGKDREICRCCPRRFCRVLFTRPSRGAAGL